MYLPNIKLQHLYKLLQKFICEILKLVFGHKCLVLMIMMADFTVFWQKL